MARSQNPLQFEDKVRENQRSDPKFSFLNPADPYHAYYRHKMTKLEQGNEEEMTSTQVVEEMPVVKDETPAPGRIVPLEPPPAEFIMDTPSISAVEL